MSKTHQMQQVTIDHHIQRTIMKAFLESPTASYSRLKPEGIESNLFLYHLRQLIAQGLIEKDGKTYHLGVRGKQFLDRSNLDTMVIRVQPKVISMLAVQNPAGEYLILERLHQPFMNLKGFPSGKLHFGESLLEGAYRELEDKSGLTADDVELRLRGNVAMRFFSADPKNVVNHVVSYVFAGTCRTAQSNLFEKPLLRTFWADETVFSEAQAIKGHDKILQMLKRDGYFIESLDLVSIY